MEIKLDVDPKGDLASIISKELVEENRNLKNRVGDLQGTIKSQSERLKKIKKIRIKGLKRVKGSQKKVIFNSKYGKKISINITGNKDERKAGIKTGYISGHTIPNVEDIINQKVREIVNKRDRIRIAVKPRKRVEKADAYMDRIELENENIEKTFEKLAKEYERERPKKIAEKEKIVEKIKVVKPKQRVRVTVKHEQVPAKKVRGPNKTLMVKSAFGDVKLKLKPSEKKEDIPSGYIGGRGFNGDMGPMLELMKEMMHKDEPKKKGKPKIEGIKIPEV